MVGGEVGVGVGVGLLRVGGVVIREERFGQGFGVGFATTGRVGEVVFVEVFVEDFELFGDITLDGEKLGGVRVFGEGELGIVGFAALEEHGGGDVELGALGLGSFAGDTGGSEAEHDMKVFF